MAVARAVQVSRSTGCRSKELHNTVAMSKRNADAVCDAGEVEAKVKRRRKAAHELPKPM